MAPFIMLPSEVAPSFSGPGDISGLSLWLDGTDQSTVWQDAAGTTPALDQDLLGRWDDKSGNGYHHINIGDPNEKPTWQDSDEAQYYGDFGFGAFCEGSYSDQGLGCLSTPLLTGSVTVICVVELWALPTSEQEWCIWRIKDGSGYYQELMLHGSSSDEPWTFVGSHNTFQTPTVGCDNGVLSSYGPVQYLLTYTYNGGAIGSTSSYQFRISGVGQTLANNSVGINTNGTDVTGFGAHMDNNPLPTGFGMEAVMGELIVYDSVLSAGDIANVEGYLTSKYSWVTFD